MYARTIIQLQRIPKFLTLDHYTGGSNSVAPIFDYVRNTYSCQKPNTFPSMSRSLGRYWLQLFKGTSVIRLPLAFVFRARHPLFISRRRVYFPWDRINWIKEVLSNDGKAFLIPRDLLKPVSIKLKERYGKPQKQVYVTEPADCFFS